MAAAATLAGKGHTLPQQCLASSPFSLEASCSQHYKHNHPITNL